MTSGGRRRPEPVNGRRLLEILVVAALYFLAARLGLRLAFSYKNVSSVWPPSGVALTALLATRLRAWPGVSLGAFLANFSTGLPLPTAALIAVGNTLEGLTGAYLLQRSSRFLPSLSRLHDVLLLLLAAVVSAAVASTLGVASLALAGIVSWNAYLPAWLTWWLGDAMGILVVGSVLLAWVSRPWPIARAGLAEPRRRILEAAALAASLFVVTDFVFGSGKEYPYAVFPALIWAALRFGQRGAATGVAVVSGIAVWATLHGAGPFVKPDPSQSLIYLQTFMAVVSVTTVLLGAAVTERRQAEEALREADRRFKLGLEHSDITVYSQDRDLRYTWIYDGRHRFPPEVVLGRMDCELAPADEAAILTEIKRRVLETGNGERREATVTTQGQTSVYDLVVEPMRDSNGQIVGVSGVANDITEIKRYQSAIESLNERLRHAMRETHHRVKNNLQVIASMIDMNLVNGSDHVSAEEVKRFATVTRTLATVHDLLTHEAKEDGRTNTISAKEMAEKLVPMLQTTALGRPLRLDVEDVRLSARQGTSLAIVISELVGNAIKHGAGDVSITLRHRGDTCILEVTDQGPGFPPSFDLKKSAGTGLQLVENLSRWDLDGGMTCSNPPSGGARVSITLRAAQDQPHLERSATG